MSLDVTVRGITIPPDELTWRFSRSPGPGGQSVNTADTRAELSFDLAGSAALPPALKRRALAAVEGRLGDGVITVAASEYRSQLRNREAAAGRMAELLAEATAPPPLGDDQTEVKRRAGHAVHRPAGTPGPHLAARRGELHSDRLSRHLEPARAEAERKRSDADVGNVPQPRCGIAHPAECIGYVLAMSPGLHDPGRER